MKVKYQRKIQGGHAGQPNPPMHPTPLRVDKIVAILKGVPTRSLSRSTDAARVMGIPLDDKVPSRQGMVVSVESHTACLLELRGRAHAVCNESGNL
jgi:hypothetical protein